jgi:hypothetical protein
MGKDGRPLDAAAHVLRPNGLPSRPPNSLDIEPGPIGESATYLLLNDTCTEVWVHWLGNRSLPCLNALGKCPDEIHKYPLAWRAYIGGMNVKTGVIKLLSITYDAARHYQDFCQESTALRLRGRLLSITRKEGPKKNPQKIWFVREAWTKKVPPDVQVMTVLQTIWCGSPIYRDWIAENVTGSPPDENFGHPQEELP